MKRRILMMILALALLLTVGCTDKTEAENTQTSEKTTETKLEESNEIEPATIYLWTAWTPDRGIQDIIDSFNEIYPMIEVIPVQFSNNTDGNLKVDTTLASTAMTDGEGIDVFFNFGVHRLDPRVSNQMLLNLDPYIERDGFDVIDELGEGIYQYDDSYYALPATSNAYCVYLNKNMLDEAELTTPDSWTMDEFYSYAEAMTTGEGADKIYGSDGLRPYYQWLFMATNTFASNPWYNSDGTSNLDNPYYEKVLEAKYIAEEVDKIQYPYTEYMSTKVSTVDNFMNGKVAMAIYGNSLARFVKDLEKYPHDFPVEIAPLPVVEEGDTNYNVGGYFGYLGVNANTQEPDASWLLLKYLITEGSSGFLSVGHIPTWKYADTDLIIEKMLGENADELINVQQFKDVILNQKGMPQQVLTDFTAYGETIALIGEELEQVIYGKDAAEAVADLADKANQAIADNK